MVGFAPTPPRGLAANSPDSRLTLPTIRKYAVSALILAAVACAITEQLKCIC